MRAGCSRESTSTIPLRCSISWRIPIQLLDVNVLVYAHRKDSADHARFRRWLEDLLGSGLAFGVPDLVLSGFLRVVTHPKAFARPSPLATALAFAGEVRGAPVRVSAAPGANHWDIFTRLCRESGAKGNLVADAYLAAVAIEQGAEWVTTDRDYARFKGLRWRHPLG